MKKIIVTLLVIALIAALPLACAACKKGIRYETLDLEKYPETIDLSNYTLVKADEFEGEELDSTLWSDTRQGTRREGFWTKNLAFVDGDGHLVIRTEKRGSRYCSDTHTRQVAGYNGSTVKVTYDDCNPFGLIAGDFGNIAGIHAHTKDLTGYMLDGMSTVLCEQFRDFLDDFDIPTSGETYLPTMDPAKIVAYTPFYSTAMLLYNYYSFVMDTKTVSTNVYESALIGINHSYVMAFGDAADPHTTDFRALVSKLFGFSSVTEFASYAQALADTYAAYSAESEINEALENGCFRSGNTFVFPIAIQNATTIVLTYVIIDEDGTVTVWLNDVAAALTSINADATHSTGGEVNNEMYCKNTLFVTGPEGVYSGAIRTMDTYTHGYGYYEIRCKLPSTTGIWHAFWLMCGDIYSELNGSADGVEIDVFEYLPNRDAINVALHWDGYDEAHQNVYKRFDKTTFGDDEYHTFGVLWDETGYTFYIEGHKVWHTTGDGICDREGYLIISTEYDDWGDWVGSLDLQDLPVNWLVDYVRVYEKNA